MTLNGNFSNSTMDMNISHLVDATEIFGPQRDSLYIVLPITIIDTIIFISGLLGNIFTCFIIIQNKNLHTATNVYLFSLAISDILLLVSGMPQEMYSIWSKWPYIFGNNFCILRGLAVEISANASVLAITLFTIERYLAICHPFRSHQMSKLSRSMKHVLLLWAVAIALAIPQAYQFGIKEYQGVAMCLQIKALMNYYFELSTLIFFLSPLIVMTVLYTLIGIKLYKSNTCEHNVDDKALDRNNIHFTVHNKMNTQSTNRAIKMLVAVVVTFFICWAPFPTRRLGAIYNTSVNHLARALSEHVYITYLPGAMYLSTCINPIFYHLMSNNFREAMKNTKCQWCFPNTSQPPAQQCLYTTGQISRDVNPGRSSKSWWSFGNSHLGNMYLPTSEIKLNQKVQTISKLRKKKTIFEQCSEKQDV